MSEEHSSQKQGSQNQAFHDLVSDQMSDIKPLKREATHNQRAKPRTQPGTLQRRADAQKEVFLERNQLASEEQIALVDPHDQLSYKRDGVQHGVFKNLRLGKYPLQARLDLHHHSVEQARRALFEFIRDCVEADVRSAIITHGKGELRHKPALLKSCVNHWLRQLDAVLAFHTAQLYHGGSGATYVMLRKSAAKRDLNRERHQTSRKGIS
ncbi:DNA endonuclease SmrA [Porticoccus sp. W117]|uniref:DNA endonuclease SmrA n=1 Tax=Porticoccus sp. W117 TaxID=3054777 RepID=UPI002596E3EE|nr:DNA endonuclease SmrA [Porticoccus sp. W117]MDM3871774.1 DNA endonuclease SmrA [Porticoccus sp. W117]